MEVEEQRTPERPRVNFGGRSGKKDFTKQSKIIIGNVYKLFKNLADDPQARDNLNFSQVLKLTSKACGVSEKSIQRIKKKLIVADENEEEVVFDTPRKTYKREKKCTEMDDFNKEVVRKAVLVYYQRGEFPTLRKIKADLMEKINYSGSLVSVLRLLKSLGFRYRKCNDGRKFLMERQDIAASRAIFLRKMHDERLHGTRPIVYLDETWVCQNHTKQYIWQDSKNNGGLKVPTGRGTRLIISHAGSASTGFIPDAKLVFRGGKKSGHSDYHTEMNGALFKDWFKNNLLCRLEEGSIIVMDNASYHSTLKEKIPTSKWRKNEIVQWLQRKGIQHDPIVTRAELLSMPQIKLAEKIYELDVLANEMGHEVVRLPPYHCHYNPIELIWAQVKRDIASKNKTFKIADVEQLANEALDNITVEDWANCVRHAEKLQEEDFEKQCATDTIIEPFIVNLAESSDDSWDTGAEPSSEDE